MRKTGFSSNKALFFFFLLIPGIAICIVSVFVSCITHPKTANSELRFWLENMVWYHRYSLEEMSAATGRSRQEISRDLEEYDINESNRPPLPQDRLLVLPYPGGRHPRIGFLEGAINPQRDTKFSIFLPWKDAGYVVVDLPEALWSNLGLTYLAHTHIPTIWDKAGIKLERVEWTRKEKGVLESRRVLPNGIVFSARVAPNSESVDMELRLKNGTQEKLTRLRAQICFLLKGAPDFNAQINDNKTLLGHTVAVRSRDGKRWIVATWDRAKLWANPPCPCMHPDPVFPDLPPAEEVVTHGRLFFYEGSDIQAEIARREKAGSLNW